FIFRAEEAGTYVLKFYKEDFIRDYILGDHVQVIVGEAPAAGGAGWFSPPVDRGRVTAEPRWPSVAQEAELRRGGSGEGRPPASGTAMPADGSLGEVPREEGSGAGASGRPGAGGVASADGADSGAGGVAGAGGIASAGGVASAAASETAEPGERESLPPGAIPPGAPPETYFQKALEEFNAGRVGAAIAVLDGFRERFPSGSDEAWWLLGRFYEASSPSRDIRTALDYYRRLIREYPQSPRCGDAQKRIAYLERFYINIR
ncbi:MAG: tetratricopeptide repeat protein, partial [Treponema sp.]|nr:tetratricopeptide repeat protein [Treponema sp.]